MEYWCGRIATRSCSNIWEPSRQALTMNVGDRLVCVLPTVLPVGSSFSIWPLHVTIVPWFRSPQSAVSLLSGLGKALVATKSFEVQMGESGVKFGHQKGKLATLVQLPTQLISVERLVRNFLHDQQAWVVDESTKQQFVYRPHVTNQGLQTMQFGESFNADRIYIIEQMGSYKRAAGEILFDA